jgi:hypothetical protein
MMWRIFTNPAAKRVNERWMEIARVYVAQFRAGYGHFINDPWCTQQITELSEASPEFRELWARHDVHNRSEGRKVFHHPLAGELDFDILWLQPVDSGELGILVHTPRNADTIDKIAQLLAREPERDLLNEV